MALIFCDCFDNYQFSVEFWDNLAAQIDYTPGVARTGPGCLSIPAGAFGPTKQFTAHYTNILFATCWDSSEAGIVFDLFCDTGNIIEVAVQADRSVTIQTSPGDPGPYVQTAPGLVTFNSYNSIAVQVQNFTNTTGIITCWINGVLVLHQTGLNTRFNGSYPNPAYCSGVRLMAPGGIPNHCRHDDVYCLDCSTPPHTTFLGALRMYAGPPTANGAVAWTPLAPPNWSQVAEAPPDGDTSYNASGNVGDQDQYVYPLPAGVPAASSIPFVQHELDMEVDSGSRSVASVLNGVVAPASTALTNGYHIYPTPWDTNPSTGLPWTTGDFPVQAGPKVTA